MQHAMLSLAIVSLAAMFGTACKPASVQSGLSAVEGTDASGQSYAYTLLPIVPLSKTAMNEVAKKDVKIGFISCRGSTNGMTPAAQVMALEAYARKSFVPVKDDGVSLAVFENERTCAVRHAFSPGDVLAAMKSLKEVRSDAGASQSLFLAFRWEYAAVENSLPMSPLLTAISDVTMKSREELDAFGELLLSLDKRFNPCVGSAQSQVAYSCQWHSAAQKRGHFAAKAVKDEASVLNEIIAKVERRGFNLGNPIIDALGDSSADSSNNLVYSTYEGYRPRTWSEYATGVQASTTAANGTALVPQTYYAVGTRHAALDTVRWHQPSAYMGTATVATSAQDAWTTTKPADTSYWSGASATSDQPEWLPPFTP